MRGTILIMLPLKKRGHKVERCVSDTVSGTNWEARAFVIADTVMEGIAFYKNKYGTARRSLGSVLLILIR